MCNSAENYAFNSIANILLKACGIVDEKTTFKSISGSLVLNVIYINCTFHERSLKTFRFSVKGSIVARKGFKSVVY